MAWDTVPWFVGGGATHSPEVARTLAYAAFRGNEGIIGSGDLAVKPLSVPGASVVVSPGACAITSRATNSAYQSYVGRNVADDTVAIAATGSGGGRSDLIVARVEDPNPSGEPWADPSDPTVGPYIFSRVISNVPSTTKTVAELGLGYSAIALARIDIPASTGTITAGMITDLRKVANPRRERELKVLFPASDDNIPTTVYATWPAASVVSVQVPEWATTLRIVYTLEGIERIAGSGATVAGLRTVYNGSMAGENGILNESTAGRGHYLVAGEHAIPAADRGTTKQIACAGLRASGSGNYQADYQSIITVDYEFLERAA